MRTLICIIIILTFFKGHAQIEPCGTKPFSNQIIKEIERIADQYKGISMVGITYLPIKIHLTRSTVDGTNYYPVSQVVYEVSKLNEKFLPIGFQFYMCDTINYINGLTLDYLAGNYDTSDSLALLVNNRNNAINIYFVNDSDVGGRSNFPSGNKFFNWMFVKNGVREFGEVLIHEMGHYFNLYHTFETFVGAERVNGSNCSTAGDLVCDTPADRYPPTYNKVTCSYTGTFTDANGQHYTPSMNNYMSYYSGGCRHSFSAGQASRAQAAHATRLNLINAAGNQYSFSYPSNNSIHVTNLRAFELYGSVRLRWQSSASTLGYIIERSTSPSTGFIAVGGVAGFEFIDKSVMAGTTYYYRVKSVTSATNYSPVLSFTPSSNSYTFGSSYDPEVHDIRHFRFFASTGLKFTATFPRYADPYTDHSLSVYTVEAGKKYRVSWLDHYYAFGSSPDRDSFKVWIDLNQNKVFENSEILGKGFGEFSSDSLFIPANTKTGYYRLRFRTNSLAPFSHSDRQLYSDTKDITLYVNGTCANALPTIGYLYQDIVSGQSIKTVDYTYLYPDPYTGYPVKFSAPSVILNPGFFADGYNAFTADTNGCN